MKKSFLLFITVIILSVFTAFSQKQTITYTDSWGQEGYTLISSKSSGVEVNYSINEFSLKNAEIKGEMMQNIELSGNFLFNNEGMPDLPGGGKYIALPEGAEVVLNISDFKTEKYQNINMAPAPRIPFDTEDGELEFNKNTQVYSENKFYPENPVNISEITQIRGVDVVMLGITPFQYNPVTKELIVYKDIKIELEFKNGTGQFGDNRLRSRWWDPILQDALLNYSSLPKIDYKAKAKNTKDDEFEYVIITLDDDTFVQWADSIAEFRRQQGVSTGVFTITEVGGNTVNAIESWVDNAYANWETPPVAVLLLADYGNGTSGITSQSYPHPYSGTFITDNKYADYDNDDLPDIAFARIAANNETQLQVMIEKDLNYERNPPTSENFYNNPITALGWQTERWFQICSEVIGGFWNSLGKETVRINAVYSGNPNSDPWSTATNTSAVINYFGPNGLEYIPASPSALGGWTGGNASAVNNALNSGAFMLQHRDHGMETGWGEPSYVNSNINSLTNTDLSFIMSINCLTGQFDYGSESFAEKFQRHTAGGEGAGALGIIAATQVSYSFVNDTYVWGAYDNMWPEFMPDEIANPESRMIMPAFANVAGKNFLYQSGWPYNTDNKQITYRLFHHHGDAFMNVYSEVPQELIVECNEVHIYGTTDFEVTTDEDAFLSLTYFNEETGQTEIIAVVESDGTESVLSMDNCPEVETILLLTITKQNYYRYTKEILVISPAGPYVIVNDFNNSVDYGQAVNMNISVKNVGTETANDVNLTISTTDENVVITNGTFSYGDIVAGGIGTANDAFTVTVSDNLEDQYKVAIDIEITSGNKTLWEQTKRITVNAPVLEVNFDNVVDSLGKVSFISAPETTVINTNDYLYEITTEEIIGNENGMLDPGETVCVIMNAANNGHATSLPATCTLTTTHPEYVTLNSDTMNIEAIEVGESLPAEFSISVDENTPIGTFVEIIFTFVSGEYEVTLPVNLAVGLQVEDFETGDFSAYAWSHGGNSDWTIVDTEVNGGIYSAKSGSISHNQTSELSITIDVTSNSEISFWSKISSEPSYDFLKFYIDGSMLDQWSGTEEWAEHIYDVSEGVHTLKWSYEKDGSVSGDEDCAWIDDIIFPGHITAKGTRSVTITVPTCPEWLELIDNGDGTGTLSGTAPLEAGDFDVVLQAEGEGDPTVQEFTISVGGLSVKDLNNDIKIFPNPNKGTFMISSNKSKEELSVEIYNTAGQIIYKNVSKKDGNLSVDISDKAKGVYFIKITSNDKIYNSKISIK